jgi:hypothetical protein
MRKGDAMKSIFRKEFILAGAMLLGAVGTAHAGMEPVVHAKVPFAFVVNGQTLPAGKYIIQRDDLSLGTLLIRSDEKSKPGGVFVTTIRDGGPDPAGKFKPVLMFKKVENQYRLTSVWDGEEEGFDVVGR